MTTRRKIRVLVVDDAVVVRRLVSDVIAADPQLEVVGSASNGKIALEKIPALTPDAVTLDIEMPEMNGLETLRVLRRQWPRLPVVMFSTLTEHGAKATLEAFALGASDYVTKPANVGSVTQGIERVRDELVPKLKALCGAAVGLPRPAATYVPRARVAPARGVAPAATGRVEAVVIGVSTGGPNALATVVGSLPKTLAAPVLIVQHMPPVFTRLLAERLAAKSPLAVREARARQPVEPGVIWLAPGDHHLLVERQGTAVVTRLDQGPPENSCRPAVDPLFRSAVGVWGDRVLAVVLTGMGQDGLAGCECVRDAGGQVVVQDEATSVVWGMPGYVARSGLAQAVLPLGQLAAEIVRRVGQRSAVAADPVAATSAAPRRWAPPARPTATAVPAATPSAPARATPTAVGRPGDPRRALALGAAARTPKTGGAAK